MMIRTAHAAAESDAHQRSLRSLVTHGLANVLFDGLSRANRLNPLADPSRYNVQVIRDIPYVGSAHPSHRLDIYRPANATEPLPVVLYLHGGGFSLLSKETHWLIALLFARAGYVVCNVSYRLSGDHPFPAALEDAVDALCWLKRNAESWGGDTSRLVFAGESSGANLATALAIATCYRRSEPYAQRAFQTGLVPRAVIAACGLLQVSDPGRFARRRRMPWWIPSMLNDISRHYLRGVTKGAELADPLLILERCEAPDRPLPPFFAFAGTRDPILDDTRRLGRALQDLRVPHEVEIYPGELHAFHALPFREASRRCWRETLSFLRRNLDERAAPAESMRVPAMRSREATRPQRRRVGT
jgi:acetyl esterase